MFDIISIVVFGIVLGIVRYFRLSSLRDYPIPYAGGIDSMFDLFKSMIILGMFFLIALICFDADFSFLTLIESSESAKPKEVSKSLELSMENTLTLFGGTAIGEILRVLANKLLE